MLGILLKPKTVSVEINGKRSIVEKTMYRLVIPSEKILVSWLDETVRCERFKNFHWRDDEVDCEMSLPAPLVFLEKIREYLALQDYLLLGARNMEAEFQLAVGTSLA